MYYAVYEQNVITDEKTYNETPFGTKRRYSEAEAKREVRASSQSPWLTTRWGYEPIPVETCADCLRVTEAPFTKCLHCRGVNALSDE